MKWYFMTNKPPFILHETVHEIGFVWLCYRTLYPGCHIAAWSLFSATFSSSLVGQVHPHIFLLLCDVQSTFQSLVCGSVVSKILLWILSSTAGVTAPLPGEIFTQSYKPPAFMVACILNWVGLFLVGMLFPLIVVSWSTFIILIVLWPIFC